MRIATKWSDVSLKQYMEIADINAIDMDELDKQVKILSILSKTSEDVICQMNISNLKEAIRHCQFIYTKPLAGSIATYMRIKGKRYKVNKELNTLSGGEYIDLTSLIKEPKDITRNLPKIISIFFHPVNIFGYRKKECFENGNQTLASRNETSKLIEDNLMMDDVMNLSGFFLKNWEGLTKATLDYSELQTKKVRKKLNRLAKEVLLSTGHGI